MEQSTTNGQKVGLCGNRQKKANCIINLLSTRFWRTPPTDFLETLPSLQKFVGGGDGVGTPLTSPNHSSILSAPRTGIAFAVITLLFAKPLRKAYSWKRRPELKDWYRK